MARGRRVLWRLLGLTVIGLASCAAPLEEKYRSESAGHSYQAIVAERATDATVATPVEIYVVKTDHGVSGAPVFRASGVAGLSLRWVGDERLIIHTLFANTYVQRQSVRVGGREILIDYE